MVEEQKLYIGIDISSKYAMVSFFTRDREEPETISTIAGSELYQIPLMLCKKNGVGQWFYGEEAKKVLKDKNGICVDHLWDRALAKERISIEDEVYDAVDLLTVFFRKILMLPRRMCGEMKIESLILTIQSLDQKNIDLFTGVMEKIGIEKEQFSMIDYRESFYYYALNQAKEMWIHDVVLFSFKDHTLKSCYLSKNEKTTPQVVELDETDYGVIEHDKDLAFMEIAKTLFEGKIIQSVYLIGEDFEGDWMRQSLRVLCQGRRVFLGKNLFSKGACYAACVKGKEWEWPFIYMGDNEMKFNVSLKVKQHGEYQFLSLISAGDSWYEANAECEVILDGSPQIAFWLQSPDSKEAKIESLDLTDMPTRPAKTTRLRISVRPKSDHEVSIVIKDLGFGELFKSSQKVWNYHMEL